jgi:hypothetical protein
MKIFEGESNIEIRERLVEFEKKLPVLTLPH